MAGLTKKTNALETQVQELDVSIGRKDESATKMRAEKQNMARDLAKVAKERDQPRKERTDSRTRDKRLIGKGIKSKRLWPLHRSGAKNLLKRRHSSKRLVQPEQKRSSRPRIETISLGNANDAEVMERLNAQVIHPSSAQLYLRPN